MSPQPTAAMVWSAEPQSESASAATDKEPTRRLYQGLLLLACLSMVTTLACILLGIVARLARWDLPGLDAYAGYSIAATLFLAMPSTLQAGDHIRVTILLQRLGARGRAGLEWLSLLAGVLLSSWLAYYACHLTWVSWATHDISQGLDATPLWIPQSFIALGSIGFAVAFVDAALARLRGRRFFATVADAARAE